ncbi:MAG TPA: metallophosphoesterase, partial [Sphingobacteriaceae bacterium]
ENDSFEKGINPRLNLKKILDDVESRGVEEVIFGGDIGEPSAYRSFFESLRKFRLRLTPGNHDSKNAVRGFFQTDVPADWLEWYHSSEDDRYKYILLDSSAGSISTEQFSWLQQEVQTPRHLVIFIHHPILAADTAIDREYPLGGRDQIADLLRSSGNPVTVFCGHYHMDDEQVQGNITQVISPAASFQLRRAEEMEIDTSFFGYRLITFREEGISWDPVLFNTRPTVLRSAEEPDVL